MYQYDDPTAVASRPAATAEGTPGWFTDGNPATGQSATILRAEYMNMLMAELLSVLAAAGIDPSKVDSDQLLAALRSAGVFQTAPQFDQSTKVATMEALQAAGMHFPPLAGLGITTNTSLLAAQAGRWAEVQTAGVTVTLPALDTVPLGAAFSLKAAQAFTLKGSGTEIITSMAGSLSNTLAVQTGETLVVVSNGPEMGWYVVLGGMASSHLLGVTQTWQNVQGSRALNTTYYNTTGGPIFVDVQGVSSAAGASMVITVDGVAVIGSGSSAAGSGIASFAIVPPGAAYSAAVTIGTGTLQNWNELR